MACEKQFNALSQNYVNAIDVTNYFHQFVIRIGKLNKLSDQLIICTFLGQKITDEFEIY